MTAVVVTAGAFAKCRQAFRKSDSTGVSDPAGDIWNEFQH